MSNKSYFLTLGSLAVLFFAGVYGYQNGWFGPEPPQEVFPKKSKSTAMLVEKKKEIDHENQVVIGGVVRQKLDVEKQEKSMVLGDQDEGKRLTSWVGHSPKIDPNLNEYTKSLQKAFLNPEKYPERLSSMASPKPFDKEFFEKNPRKYLETIEPGRVFQDLTPGKGVPALRRTSPLVSTIIQGEKVRLTAKGMPNAVISFHCQSLGKFEENQLKTISVLADSEGFAQVNYVATGGTRGLVQVLAASPQMSNRLTYLIKVSLPDYQSLPQ